MSRTFVVLATIAAFVQYRVIYRTRGAFYPVVACIAGNRGIDTRTRGLVARIRRAGVLVVAFAAALAVSLTHAAPIGKTTVKLNSSVGDKIRLGGSSLCKKDVEIVGSPLDQTQGIELDTGGLGGMNSTEINNQFVVDKY